MKCLRTSILILFVGLFPTLAQSEAAPIQKALHGHILNIDPRAMNIQISYKSPTGKPKTMVIPAKPSTKIFGFKTPAEMKDHDVVILFEQDEASKQISAISISPEESKGK